jgi:lipopolysaccharide transport system permease protein
VAFNASINFIIVLALFTMVLLLSERFPGWAFLSIFPLIVLQVVFSIGLGILLGILNVFFRDAGHFFTVFLQFWFWLTPIVYVSNVFQGPIKYLLEINPLTALVEAYHDVLVFGKWPNWESLLFIAICGIAFNLLGFKLYRRVRGEMADEL